MTDKTWNAKAKELIYSPHYSIRTMVFLDSCFFEGTGVFPVHSKLEERDYRKPIAVKKDAAILVAISAAKKSGMWPNEDAALLESIRYILDPSEADKDISNDFFLGLLELIKEGESEEAIIWELVELLSNPEIFGIGEDESLFFATMIVEHAKRLNKE